MHDEVSETENIRKNLAIERMIIEGCDILLDVSQTFVRQGESFAHIPFSLLLFMLFVFMLCLCLFHFFICITHSAFNLFVFPNYMFTLLLFFVFFF